MPYRAVLSSSTTSNIGDACFDVDDCEWVMFFTPVAVGPPGFGNRRVPNPVSRIPCPVSRVLRRSESVQQIARRGEKNLRSPGPQDFGIPPTHRFHPIDASRWRDPNLSPPPAW